MIFLPQNDAPCFKRILLTWPGLQLDPLIIERLYVQRQSSGPVRNIDNSRLYLRCETHLKNNVLQYHCII